MWPGVEDGRDLLLIWRGVWAEEERLHTVTLIHSQGRARLLTLIGQRLLAAALSLARTGLDSPSVGLSPGLSLSSPNSAGDQSHFFRGRKLILRESLK